MSNQFYIIRFLKAQVVCLFIFLLCSCSNQPNQKNDSEIYNGKLIRVDSITTFDTSKLNRILNEELQQFLRGSTITFSEVKGKYQTPQNGVTLYKLTYQSSIPEKNNKPAITTGLIAIPSAFASGSPMISYQHGTVFGKTEVPTFIEESMETKLAVAQFGGNGYIVIAPDYHGLGASNEKNTYLIQKSSEQACLDLYTAAKEFLEKKNINVSHFFTLGWSQGAYNTLTYLRRLEQEGVKVNATATAATPSDLNYYISQSILNPRPEDPEWIPACFSNLLFAYEVYYDIKGLTAKAIRPEFLQAAKEFYEHKINFTDFFKRTAPTVKDYLTPEFIQEIQLGSSPLCKALTASEGYRWKSVTPLRSYYGDRDEVFPVDLAQLAINYQALLGKKNGELFTAGMNADHRGTYAFALYHVKPWFDSFLKQ
ncbi:alpha/beta hydrolase family protein [Sediminibacterium sp.]|uniref:alpha/beta hydrolase family protein n=1 Tax=Sediminibacterium sp. TaxID=1917865 RepID=UPI003F6FEE8E